MRAATILITALALALAGCGDDPSDQRDSGSDAPAASTSTAPAEQETAVACEPVEAPPRKRDGGQREPNEPLDGGRTYRLVVDTNCGSFTVELDQEQSPNAAASLVALAEAGFFDGTTFHRIAPGFVIQGGDPTGTGSGGPGYTTVDTPPGDAAYTRGVVAMAKAANEPPGAAGSQFFVVTGDSTSLPPDYAIVGTVVDGDDVVDRIGQLGDASEQPTETVVIRSVRVQQD